METLNSAARAAGFAMATADEPYDDVRAEAAGAGGRPGDAVSLAPAVIERQHRMGDWLRAMVDLFWRRAPASPA